ncbi:MAG: hypothetical protein CSB24_00900 [Deltaproteobacteria bacterium]|nr:MAG: hypothetical protein CSB24_00900 [Deltaproteobacteria bacterium]
MKPELIRKNLQKSILFQEATPEEIAGFAESSTIVIIPKGEFVYRKGDSGDAFYVIALGEAELYVEGGSGSRSSVGRIGAGGHFGETAILTGKPRLLSVMALFDLVLICFDRQVFEEILLTNNRIYRQLGVALAERLQVSFLGQSEAKNLPEFQDQSGMGDVPLYRPQNQPEMLDLAGRQKGRILQSGPARQIRRTITEFSRSHSPFLLTGEEGTGKKVISRQIHYRGDTASGMYVEVDLRSQPLPALADKLFGQDKGSLPFFQMENAGILEQACGGTVVFIHAELMPQELQRRLLNAMKSGVYFRQDSDRQIALQCRLVFICLCDAEVLQKDDVFLPELYQLVAGRHFHVPALREHKKDIPGLIEFYLEKYNHEYGKKIRQVSKDTLGMFMNYDWPGNISELSSVLRRAVMLSKDEQQLTGQILLGLPKTEGKWEFNLLRIPFIRKIYTSRLYPLVPQIIVGLVLLFALLVLFFGEREAGRNLGITLAWSIGWPLLFFSFFILSRTWCCVCPLATPGMLLQLLAKPKRNTPKIIKEYSGWIMAGLCILVLWVEIVWNAYTNPVLSGLIILTITVGSMFFSLFFSRRAWCRYLCPLGAINAIFSMPSILELRSNRHLCLNKCTDHSCFRGAEGEEHGCPMFKHPFMLDNNHDCIVCGKCIKNCQNNSIHLNLRLAPTELWSIKEPRIADTFLVVSLAAVFFPFAMHGGFYELLDVWQAGLGRLGLNLPVSLLGTIWFFSIIALFQGGYLALTIVQGRVLEISRKKILPLLGYGFIPIVLGGFLASYLQFFLGTAWRLVPNFQILLGIEPDYQGGSLLSQGAAGVLQALLVLGGCFASMYAVYRITVRLKGKRPVAARDLALPYGFLVLFVLVFLFFI